MRRTLKVVTWNCQGGLRRKLREVASLDADILVLQECSRSDGVQLKTVGLKLACWTGSNPHKGLAIAAKAELKLVARPIRGIEWAIRGTTEGQAKLGIVAIWACAPERGERYIRQVHKLLDRGVLKTLPLRSVFLGDFNSNKIWDGKHRERSHTRAVEKFDIAGFRSAYHDLLEEEQGKESTPTFFLQRLRRKPYHIDYAFLSSKMRMDLKKINIGKPAIWLKKSDHMPFSIEISRRR